MKLIIKEYLINLRERDELDAILPSLLSQMGLNVFSRPGRGTRQDGVDVAAVGRLEGGPETVYLFSIKSGDLGRSAWNSNSPQSLRPSLDAIQDSYIPHKLPVEHRSKPIAICICCGGDILETIRSDLAGYTSTRQSSTLSFQEWNGDRLADLILRYFLSEDLLPSTIGSDLRKALALLEEPDASCRHFARIVDSLSSVTDNPSTASLALRQLNLCLGILFGWARSVGNLEAPYRCSELVLLNGWEGCKSAIHDTSSTSASLYTEFGHSVANYRAISIEYLSKAVLPYVQVRHGISSAIQTHSQLDVSLKLFDVLGRLAVAGLWAAWSADGAENSQADSFRAEAVLYAKAVEHLIENNPILLLPRKDSQQIDISIALLLLTRFPETKDFIENWLGEMVARAEFSFGTKFYFPVALEDYADLLDIATGASVESFENATVGSTFFPMLSVWSALLGLPEIYQRVAEITKTHLKHCNLQLWFPDSESEASFYTNKSPHGATLSEIDLGQERATLLNLVFAECSATSHYDSLSAVSMGVWPIILVACRTHRLPLPLHFLRPMAPVQDAQQNTDPQLQDGH